jgi:hypothetical protein
MRLHLILATSPLLPALAASCGGHVATASGGGRTGTGAGSTTSEVATSSSSSGKGGGTTLSPAGCPLASPTEGAGCTYEDAVCGYGDSLLVACRAVFVCSQGTWGATPMTCPKASLECPSTKPVPQASCDIDAGASLCAYPDGAICSCAWCSPFGGACVLSPPTWFCESPSGPTACPQTVPNVGAACSGVALECSYPCVDAECANGAWEYQQLPVCPG